MYNASTGWEALAIETTKAKIHQALLLLSVFAKKKKNSYTTSSTAAEERAMLPTRESNNFNSLKIRARTGNYAKLVILQCLE